MLDIKWMHIFSLIQQSGIVILNYIEQDLVDGGVMILFHPIT
jgi:hypothetical protein